MSDVKEFKLEVPIKAHVNIDGKNDIVDIDTLYLQAPTLKHRFQVINLKKMYVEALFGITQIFTQDQINSQVSESDKDESVSAKAISFTLNGAKNFDIASFYKKFYDLLGSGLCFTDSECTSKLESKFLDGLSNDDYENLCAKYLEFFLAASWMKSLQTD